MKGDDAARARALLNAAKEKGHTAHLALIIIHQMGNWPDGLAGILACGERDDQLNQMPISRITAARASRFSGVIPTMGSRTSLRSIPFISNAVLIGTGFVSSFMRVFISR